MLVLPSLGWQWGLKDMADRKLPWLETAHLPSSSPFPHKLQAERINSEDSTFQWSSVWIFFFPISSFYLADIESRENFLSFSEWCSSALALPQNLWIVSSFVVGLAAARSIDYWNIMASERFF